MATGSALSLNRDTAHGLARGLGWFSIALGLGEIIAAEPVRREIGAPVSPTLFRAYGVREIATGLAIIALPQPTRVVWARVAGDILDLVTLLPTLSATNHKRTNAAGAVAFVAVATLLDIAVASMGERGRGTGAR